MYLENDRKGKDKSNFIDKELKEGESHKQGRKKLYSKSL
jgi:hypothetical protein